MHIVKDNKKSTNVNIEVTTISNDTIELHLSKETNPQHLRIQMTLREAETLFESLKGVLLKF